METGTSTRAQQPTRLGVVSFVNTVPLIDGLEDLADLDLRFSVPSLLLGQLERGEIDVGLCSSIDYQRSAVPLVMVPGGLLGCRGRTLTVRLYSSVPLDRIGRVHCDTDSHTSIALMQILLRDLHGVDPQVVPYDAREHVAENRPVDWPEAMLLIGDKVVTDSPPAVRYPHQMDLGAAWTELTGRPFVFAFWMARESADADSLETAAAALDRQRRANSMRMEEIIVRRAIPRGWPRDLAEQYLTRLLDYEVSNDMLAGLDQFFTRAHAHNLIDTVRPVRQLERKRGRESYPMTELASA